jgi:membrane protease YdiL (CAAX protease family)
MSAADVEHEMTATGLEQPQATDRRALATFLVLGLLLSWYPWVLHLMGRPGNGGPNPLGLLVAALIAAAVDRGWSGSLAILRGMIRLRGPASVWLTAVALPFLALACALIIASAMQVSIAFEPPAWSDLLDRFVFALLFVALGEEPAWRGFLLPLLQRGRTPVAATLILSAIWAVWHLPLMGTEFAWPLVPYFLLSLLGAAFVLSWLYNASGSVLPCMAMHAVLNTASAGYVFTLIAKPDVERFWTIYGAVWLAAGMLAVALTRGRLGRPAV